MATKTAHAISKRGKKTIPGAGWRLQKERGSAGLFKATLLKTLYVNGNRVAVFSVPARG
jgi:hypothetical protein